MADERRNKGWEMIRTIHGDVADATVRSMREIAPDMGEFIVSFAFGEIYTRPELDIKTRQICTVAMLAAMGAETAPQLKAHIKGALNVGWTKEEIVEVLMQTAVYAGFPAAINALTVAKRAFRDEEKPAEE